MCTTRHVIDKGLRLTLTISLSLRLTLSLSLGLSLSLSLSLTLKRAPDHDPSYARNLNPNHGRDQPLHMTIRHYP